MHPSLINNPNCIPTHHLELPNYLHDHAHPILSLSLTLVLDSAIRERTSHHGDGWHSILHRRHIGGPPRTCTCTPHQLHWLGHKRHAFDRTSKIRLNMEKLPRACGLQTFLYLYLLDCWCGDSGRDELFLPPGGPSSVWRLVPLWSSYLKQNLCVFIDYESVSHCWYRHQLTHHITNMITVVVISTPPHTYPLSPSHHHIHTYPHGRRYTSTYIPSAHNHTHTLMVTITPPHTYPHHTFTYIPSCPPSSPTSQGICWTKHLTTAASNTPSTKRTTWPSCCGSGWFHTYLIAVVVVILRHQYCSLIECLVTSFLRGQSCNDTGLKW